MVVKIEVFGMIANSILASRLLYTISRSRNPRLRLER